MMEVRLRTILLIYVLRLSLAELEKQVTCESPQYLSFNQKDTIHCDFGEEFYGVYWYNTSDYDNEDPFLYFTEGQKSGIGYESGEFDVYPNGSLIINRVSLQHEHTFTVIMFKAIRKESTIPNFVQVVVTVKPVQKYPMIDACDGQRVCFRDVKTLESLNCYITSYRPKINLTFSSIAATGKQRLPDMIRNMREGDLYTTTRSLKLPINDTNAYIAISCEASEPPYLFTSRDSAILLRNGDISLSKSNPEEQFVEQHSLIKLPCSGESNIYFVWMKQDDKGVYQNLFEALTVEPYYENVASPKYSIDMTEMSLKLDDVDVNDEGHYICVSGDGVKEYIRTFSLNVYIRPNNPYLKVDGCGQDQYNCKLETSGRGTLICKLEGIRPIMNLTWDTVNESSEEISFLYSKLFVSHRGDVYDLSLVAEYKVVDPTVTKISVSCKADLPTNHPVTIYLLRVVDLIVSRDVERTKPPSNAKSILPIILPSVFIAVCLLFAVVKYKESRRDNSKTYQRRRALSSHVENEEHTPLNPQNSTTMLEKKEIFKRELTSKYRELCEAVRRLSKRGTTGIAEMFVDEGMEVLNIDSSGDESWSKLDSYHYIMKDKAQDARIILEGGAGYGKSILCLKMAYDWYTKEKASPLKDVDIFILLYLRYLGNDIPLHLAIKQHLLPSDTQLTPDDISSILSTSTSAVIVLDGYNRYPLIDKYEQTEIKEIMMKRHLQNCRVMVTTRTAKLPDRSAKLTKRIRLSGFDEEARKRYICNVLAPNDNIEVERIQSMFAKVHGVIALCQVPFFFTLLTDLIHDQIINEIADMTVTKFFQSIMGGLQQLPKKKMDHQGSDENKDSGKKRDEQQLFMVAFKGLCTTDKGLLWEQEKLRHDIGTELYDKYCDIGILVEEEVYEGSNRSDNLRNANYLTKVKFYHNVFCEWFAAHELSRTLPKTYDASVKILQQIDPLDHQYVFRFACGLNEKAAKHIIRYIEKIRDGDKYATLCIMETGEIKDVVKVVKHMCTLPIHISKEHSHLLQRSITQVLLLAAENQINIEVVWLAEMDANFIPEKKSLAFNSGFDFPILRTMNQLSITETGKKLSLHRLEGILEYAKLCDGLGGIRFRGCILPFTVKVKCLEEIRKKKISVDWMPPVGKRSFYHLNTKYGCWEIGGDNMTEEEYRHFEESL